MRAYYLIPESTAERVLTGLKSKCAKPSSPGVEGQSCFDPHPPHVYRKPDTELVPTSSSSSSSSSLVVSPHVATPSTTTRSVKKQTYKKKKKSRSGVYKTTKLPPPVQLRATGIREKKISSNPEISNLVPLYVKSTDVPYVNMLLERMKDNPIVKWDSRGNLLSSARPSNILDMLNMLSNSSQKPTVTDMTNIKHIVNATGILPSEIKNSRVRQKIQGSGITKQPSMATYAWVPY